MSQEKLMIARLYGRSNIYNFKIEIFGDIKTFDFLKVDHQDCGKVLCQVINITRDNDKLIGDCKVIGYREAGVLKNIRTPFSNEAEVEVADDVYIEETVGLNTDSNDFIGVLEHHADLRISLDLKKTITKHIAVLAKSGAGKSYTVGVFLEEVMKKNIPIVIMDPHNEYSSIKYPNTDKKDMKRLEKFGLHPQGFLERVREYSPDTNVNPQCEPISLDINTLRPQDLIESLPQKISPAQQSLIFNVLSNLNNRVNFDELIFNLSNEESNSKWSLISLIEQLKKLKVYSSNPTPLQDIVKYRQMSIVSLKGVEPYVQETFVSGLLKELFEARKKEEIPPFLLVLEEAHNFCVTKDTQILTENGLCDISKIEGVEGLSLLSFNHEKQVFEKDKILKNHPKRKANIIKLVSGSGNEIKCTPDHPIFDKGEYIKAEFAQNISIPLIEKYSFDKTHTQARLFGALYSDGWVSVNKQVGFSGKYEDMDKIKKELEFLGLSTSKVSTFENKSPSLVNSGDKLISISGKGSSISGSHEVFNYFTKLGAIIGERVKQETKIPSWILNGSKEIKAEFLAGLMGGDGLKLQPYGRNFYAIRLYFSKLKEIKNLGDKYAEELMSLFKDLGVKTTLSYRRGNIRKKDGKESMKFIITISNEDSNLINFLENIGYRYNSEKEILAKKALIYLKNKQELIKNQEIVRQKAIKLQKENGWGKIKISRELNLPSSLIAKWIYDGKNYSKSAGLSKNFFPKYLEWEEDNSDANFVYDTILYQEDLGEDFVYNVTTKNENYIANNMLVHNCPERGFGELKTSKVIRTIAGEGRKFGIGLCVISQRPAKVDKNVVSQCTTQILLKMTNPNDIKSVIASSEGVDSSSENEIQKLNIGTCLLTGVIDIPLKVNIRPRITKHGGETVDITLGYEANGENPQEENSQNLSQKRDSEYNPSVSRQNSFDNQKVHAESSSRSYNAYERVPVKENPQTKNSSNNPNSEKRQNSEFIQFISPELEIEDAKTMLDTNNIEVQLVPASLIKLRTFKGEEVNLLFDMANSKLIKTVFPFEGFDVSLEFTKLTESEKKLLKVIFTLEDKFNPAELLLKSDVMFNEILRICDSLARKRFLNKLDRNFEITGAKFAKNISNLNFYGNQKFEEISFDSKVDARIDSNSVKSLFSMFGSVENIKEIFILRYLGR